MTETYQKSSLKEMPNKDQNVATAGIPGKRVNTRNPDGRKGVKHHYLTSEKKHISKFLK